MMKKDDTTVFNKNLLFVFVNKNANNTNKIKEKAEQIEI